MNGSASTHGEEDRQDLGHERQRHLLHLGQRLEQRDGDAHHQRHEHDRRADLDQHEDRLAGDVEDLVRGHAAAAIGGATQIGIRMMS